ncbi:MAG TPA: thioesterase family protein [Solirubrobacteraceae bacterium]|nr:thioesterase family protein [Solirubrobacteraceae bacterium]
MSLFDPLGDGRVMPTAHTRGPWDPRALHGGAAGALIARAFERFGAPAEPAGSAGSAAPPAAAAGPLIARIGVEFVKPIPFAELTVPIEVVRGGRRVQELSAELRAGPGEDGSDTVSPAGDLIGRAGALLIQPVPRGLPDPDARRQLPGPGTVEAMPGPDEGEPIVFALDTTAVESFATSGVEMRWLSDPRALGPARVWMRMAQPIVGDEPASPLARLVATADFGNGVSRELDFENYLFINADLTVHLWRAPRGEWIGLDAKTVLMDEGSGTAESVVHDLDGPVGRAFQTLVVQPR